MPASGHRRLGHHRASRRKHGDGRPIALGRLLRSGGHTAGRRTTPCGTSPVVTSCHSATSRLRARACPCGGRGRSSRRRRSWSGGGYRGDRLFACGTPGLRRGRLLRQGAVLLEHQEAPRQLDHAAWAFSPRAGPVGHPGVAGPLFLPGAGLASPFSRRRAPLSSGEPVRPA